ncbi:MAG: hypothetical protein EZS28_037046 [Streblomastix strix]|uniref:Uncharacterized protein n=1 Tax=Streblomastix strix TaxID=222440 RepID=A0A5J4UAI0_9EUKA|nr:MAG: hypothetical protein EZS28_037046 [Streblomastix strix]
MGRKKEGAQRATQALSHGFRNYDTQFGAFTVEFAKLFQQIHEQYPGWKAKQIIQNCLIAGGTDILNVEDKPTLMKTMRTILEEERLMVLQLREQEGALIEMISAIDVLTKICSTIHNLHETRLNEPFKTFYHAGILSYTPEHVLNIVKSIKNVYLNKSKAPVEEPDRAEVHRQKQADKPSDMISPNSGNPFPTTPPEGDQTSFPMEDHARRHYSDEDDERNQVYEDYLKRQRMNDKKKGINNQ